MISIHAISKWYGAFHVLKDCSTEIQKGEAGYIDSIQQRPPFECWRRSNASVHFFILRLLGRLP
jgi:hypothetical protein